VLLGPLVASTSFHEPTMLAKQAATVDGISGGRLLLGLGAGWNEREYRAFGFPYDRRVSRFAEAFTIVRTLLAEGEIDFAGEFYRADRCVLHPRPVRPGGPPLMVGSVRPRMLSITIPYVDAWNVWWSDYGNTPAGFAELKSRVDEQVTRHGRAVDSVAGTCAVLVQLPGGVGRRMGAYGGSPVEPIRGSADEVAEQIRAFAAVGAEHVQLVVDPITRQSIEWFEAVLVALDRPM
jgi:alkanesulfonate monooxygenase SsuD/methylene tetrahydromethanopterin reductase-like flavin-dependent oxidoreductase (luciferase family)